MNIFVDLMVFDVKGESGGVDVEDFEDALSEYMLEFFHVEGDDESIEQIAKIMIKVRKELVALAISSR
jgi:hypothetical protein